MILSFGDAHFGLRSYSTLDAKGWFTAEYDAQIAFEDIYKRASEPDIDLILGTGDITHINRPSAAIVQWLIGWFTRMNSLGKKFYLIPGNHDDSIFNNSMVFLKAMNLENVILVDDQYLKENSNSIQWGDWTVRFAPYKSNMSLKDKNEGVHSLVRETLQESFKKTIVVSHIHEADAKLGSEQVMISKGVDIIDTDLYNKEDIILLIGHIHRHQIYKKGNTTVCYPGGTYYMDVTDVGQQKGYVLINETGEISFKEIVGIRKFFHYKISEGVTPLDFLKKMRLPKNSVMFFTLDITHKVNLKELKEYVQKTGNYFGKVYYVSQAKMTKTGAISTKTNDPLQIIRAVVSNIFKEDDSYKAFGLTEAEATERLFKDSCNTYYTKGDTKDEVV